MASRKHDRTAKTNDMAKAGRTLVDVDIKNIVADGRQSRGDAVLPALAAAGYGIFKPVEGHDDKTPLVLLLLGTADEMAKGVGLVVIHEPDLMRVVDSLKARGQMQNIQVSLAVNDEGDLIPDKYYLRLGMRRTIAKAVIHAQSGGKIPARMWAEVVDRGSDKNGFLEALEENTVRKYESPIDQAKLYLQLKKQNMTLKEIAEAVGED